VESAFLNGNLEEEIYMDCPDGMERDPEDYLLLLKSNSWVGSAGSTILQKVSIDSSKDWFCSKLCRPMSDDKTMQPWNGVPSNVH
jgi:hypothetical protein